MPDDDGPGYVCPRMRAMPAVTEEQWRAAHEQHGAPAETARVAAPSYDIVTLRCPCGARLVVMEQWETT